MIKAIYSQLCPICHGDLTTEEIEKNRCNKKGMKIEKAYERAIVKEFFEFFSSYVGKPRAIQKLWAKRILNNESFAAIAPTGIGKSTFGIAMASFLARKNRRSYLLFPTTLLVQQAVEKLEKMESLDFALFYHSKIDKERFFERINRQDFRILITTNQFLAKNFDKIKHLRFNFIFVDDVDAILKASKNVDRILHLLGFYFDGKWKGKATGVIMVSTATAKKGKKANLFRQLLNFDIGSSTLSMRNITDVFHADLSKIESLLADLKRGAIIYAKDSKEAEKWYEKLKKYGVGIVTSQNKEAFELFKEGKLNHLIGLAHYYGTLTRGIDLPEEIKYAIFVKAPVNKIRIDSIDDASPNMIKFLANLLQDDEEIKKFIPLPPDIEKRKEYLELKEAIKKALRRSKREDFVIKENELIFPDIRTYIQASGRTSRFTSNGITKGASFLFEDDDEIASSFIKRASYYDIEFEELGKIDLKDLIERVEESRRKGEYKDIIKPTLFIVESPTKAKQIARFFGKPSIRYSEDIISYEVAGENRILIITASLGHITDLITNKGYHGVITNNDFIPIYSSIKKCMDCGYQFTNGTKCPKCGSSNINDSKKRIDGIRKLAYEVEEVIIATDPDAEGEKIAWDLRNMVAWKDVKRAEFHEITRNAIKNALNNLRSINESLVEAQIVRRIEDRWIGFVLSQKLWEEFNNRNLSAGRAQTPVLGWIIERGEENRKRKKIGVIKDYGIILEDAQEEIEVEVRLKEERKEKRMPLPPYTTDSMLKDANRILKIGADETMKIAQTLFENGLITYHRTDSTRVSEVALKVAKDYLKENFVARRWGAEGMGAHECIRPTRAWERSLLERLIKEGIIFVEGIERKHLALYDLIFRRFMASMSPDFEVVVKKYEIRYDGKVKEEERIVDARGFSFSLYKSVAVKKEIPTGRMKWKVEIKEVPLAPLYTQSDIISKMKENGIGRPSTYATIIQKLFMRGYIGEKNGAIFPTKKGIKIFDYLDKNYHEFVSVERTRKLQEEMDMVESGKADYHEVLKSIYEEIKKIG